MIVKPNLVYSISEVSEILNINTRKLQRVAKNHNLKKIDNRYVFEGSFILDVFKKEMSESVATNKALKEIIKDLKAQLKSFEVNDNERIEVFTNESYEIFENRLKEWHTLQTDIKHQEEVFNLKIKGADDRADHYEKQFEYQRKQSERILEMHQKLIQTIGEQTQNSIQRNHIEAKDKKYL